MNRAVIVIGAGGHAKVVIDVLRRCGVTILGCTDVLGKESISGTSILGTDSVIQNFSPDEIYLVNGLGMLPKTKPIRAQRFVEFKKLGYQFMTIIHPSAIVAEDVVLAEGVQVMAATVIQPGTRVGENTIINTSSSIDHDCQIDANCHIAPGAVLSGGVCVGEHSFIGAGAVIIQNKRLPQYSIIRAGQVVYKDIITKEVNLNA